jgi:hypothetical protein
LVVLPHVCPTPLTPSFNILTTLPTMHHPPSYHTHKHKHITHIPPYQHTQEALSLPQYVRDITMENKLMKDFRGIMTAMRCVRTCNAMQCNTHGS